MMSGTWRTRRRELARRAAVGEPAKAGDAVRPAGADQEYDRSDLLLVQG
jgi:hypothetical protein